MKQNKQVIRPYTRQFYRGNRLACCGAFCASVCNAATMLGVSWLMKELIDTVSGVESSRSITQLLLAAAVLVAVFLTASLLNYHSLPRFLSHAIGQYKNYIFEKLSRKSIASFRSESPSAYISALSNDANVVEQNYLSRQFDLILLTLEFFGALIMMLLYSPALTAVAIGVSLLPLAASLLAGDRMEKAEKDVSERNSGFTAMLSDALNGFSVIKSFRAENAIAKLFRKSNGATEAAKCRRQKVGIVISTIGELSGVLAQFGVFFAGAALAVAGYGITAGTVIVFVQLMNFVLSPIAQIPGILANRKAATALIRKMADMLEENVRREGTVDKRELTDGITVEQLSFSYEPDKAVLHGIDFTFEAGKSYAIVGASGSGKSTLLNLLTASDPDFDGSIRYDGTDLRQIRSEALYDLVSIVQQNVFIFNASIRDNITMFAEFPEEAAERAIRLSGLSALIEQRGEDYLCGENGCNLSGGEKQRISIARALLKNARVLLADEATAALDAKTAFQVAGAILELQGMTRIVVTHALDENILQRYDCILTMRAGQIAEAGTFSELIDRKGYFYSLFTVSQ